MNEEERLARQVAARAVRRLETFGWMLTLAAALAATVGGAVTAWLIHDALPLGFRATWIVCSLLFFIVPGAAVAWREIRERRSAPPRP